VTPAVKGAPITLADGQPYTLAPLVLGQLDRLQEDIQASTAKRADGSFPNPLHEPAVRDAMLRVVGESLRRNHPEVDDAKLRDLFDLATLTKALQTACGLSGLRELRNGDGASP